MEKLRCRIRNSGDTELEIVGCRIGNSKVWNWKQWGAKLETAGCRIGSDGVWNWKQQAWNWKLLWLLSVMGS